jgi:hypothetical protein
MPLKKPNTHIYVCVYMAFSRNGITIPWSSSLVPVVAGDANRFCFLHGVQTDFRVYPLPYSFDAGVRLAAAIRSKRVLRKSI